MEAGGANQKTIPNPTVPSTSKPSESRSVASDFPQRIDSSVSLSSGSSEEDWLIKVCCPGARHRYCKNASQKVQISSQLPKSGCLHSLNKEDVSVDSSDCRAVTPYQPYPGMPRQESTDLQWLIRLRCPRAQMEQMLACRQSLPAISTSLNKLPSKTSRNSLSGRTKPLESWETQKHFSIAKGSAFLESYSPSSYDPFFLKICRDTWKASVPSLYDPLLKEIQGRYLEACIIQQCDTGKIFSSREMNELCKSQLPLLPLSRQFMNPIEWLKIPSGYMESEVRQKSRQKMRTTRNLSSMDFKSWGDPFWHPLNKRGPSARKSDFAYMPNLLGSQILTGSSVWKPAIKSAS